MRRISLEGWILLIPAVAFLLSLAVLAVTVSGREPPKSAQLPILVAVLASPLVACGVILLTLIFRMQGLVRLKHPYVFMGIALACLNILITAGQVLAFYLILKALSGGSLIFG
jgi:EamA domain-containing membrane protein RarD